MSNIFVIFVLFLVFDDSFEHAVVLPHELDLRNRVSEKGKVVVGCIAHGAFHLEAFDVVL